jgi:hypothetical protein
VLLVQNAVTALGALIDIVMVSRTVVLGDPMVGANSALATAHGFAEVFIAMLGHVLLLERVLATAMVRRYEHWRSTWFNVGWVSVLVSPFKCYFSISSMNMLSKIS